jgi:hypothetical protein
VTYYQQKASEIRDLALAHPWNGKAQRGLEMALKEIAKDQRHACAYAVAGVPHRDVDFMNAVDAHSAAMNAEIGE